MIPCLIYAILRVFYDNSMCWAEPSSDAYVEWIYMSLGLACIIANSFFFFNIFRILVTKLQAPHANEPAHFRYVFFVFNVSFIPFFVFGFWSLLAMKLRKCYITFVYILQGKMEKTRNTSERKSRI